LLESLMTAERPWLRPVAVAIFLFVTAVLVVSLRRPTRVALALVPVGIGTAFAFGALVYGGVSFNVLTLVVMPLIMGLGVDCGIHVVHRIGEEESARGSDVDVPRAVSAIGRALLFNTATTCVGFGALLFANHAGIESMALVMLAGLPLCLAASVSTVPALLALARRS